MRSTIGWLIHESCRSWAYLAEYYGQRYQTAFLRSINTPQEYRPWGSILGPLRFLIYVNDLPLCHHESDITLYADDTVIYCSATNTNDLKIKLNNDLIIISKWFDENRLTLNISKCKFVLFGSRRKLKNIQEVKLQINNTTIESAESFN